MLTVGQKFTNGTTTVTVKEVKEIRTTPKTTFRLESTNNIGEDGWNAAITATCLKGTEEDAEIALDKLFRLMPSFFLTGCPTTYECIYWDGINTNTNFNAKYEFMECLREELKEAKKQLK